jgi:carbamoyl-phosphate synthase large subunit
MAQVKKKIVILFPCVGRRVALLELFRRACARLGCKGVLIGTDVTANSAALQCCDRKYVVPPVTHRRYRGQMRDMIRKEKVDLVVPTVDLDLPIWAALRDELAAMDCTALISTPEVVRICQDKRLMYRFLQQHGFDTPETMSVAQARKLKRYRFPYFLKPWDGYASRGSFIARNRAELKFFSTHVPNCIVQEFIDGAEHTVDVLVDFSDRVRCVVPRRRLQVRSGEVSKGITVKHPQIIQRSQELIETLGAGPGVITIQCFLTKKNEIKFIEINPRFGGGVPLSVQAGADFPRWLLQLWLGKKPRISLDRWRDQLLMLRYDDAVWVQK